MTPLTSVSPRIRILKPQTKLASQRLFVIGSLALISALAFFMLQHNRPISHDADTGPSLQKIRLPLLDHQGHPEISLSGGGHWKTISPRHQLYTGVWIRTDASSQLAFQLPGGSFLRIKPRSAIRLSVSTPGQFEVKLIQGALLGAFNAGNEKSAGSLRLAIHTGLTEISHGSFYASSSAQDHEAAWLALIDGTAAVRRNESVSGAPPAFYSGMKKISFSSKYPYLRSAEITQSEWNLIRESLEQLEKWKPLLLTDQTFLNPLQHIFEPATAAETFVTGGASASVQTAHPENPMNPSYLIFDFNLQAPKAAAELLIKLRPVDLAEYRYLTVNFDAQPAPPASFSIEMLNRDRTERRWILARAKHGAQSYRFPLRCQASTVIDALRIRVSHFKAGNVTAGKIKILSMILALKKSTDKSLAVQSQMIPRAASAQPAQTAPPVSTLRDEKAKLDEALSYQQIAEKIEKRIAELQRQTLDRTLAAPAVSPTHSKTLLDAAGTESTAALDELDLLVLKLKNLNQLLRDTKPGESSPQPSAAQ